MIENMHGAIEMATVPLAGSAGPFPRRNSHERGANVAGKDVDTMKTLPDGSVSPRDLIPPVAFPYGPLGRGIRSASPDVLPVAALQQPHPEPPTAASGQAIHVARSGSTRKVPTTDAFQSSTSLGGSLDAIDGSPETAMGLGRCL